MIDEEKQNLLKKLNCFRKSELERLIRLFSKKEFTGSKKELAKFLIENNLDDIITFFDKLEDIRKISIYRAKEYLNNSYPDITKSIAEITNKVDLLIFLYEYKLLDQIDILVFNTSFRRNELKYSYILISEEDLNYREIVDKLDKVTRSWNELNFLKIWGETYEEEDGKIIITFLKEGYTTYRQFKFREEEQRWIDAGESGYKVKKIRVYPIVDRRIEITKVENGGYKVTFDFNPENEKNLMSLFVGTVFGDDAKLIKEEIKSIKDMQKEIKESVSRTPKIEAIEKLINSKKTPVIRKISARKDIPKEKREKLIEIINSLKYAGPSLKDDPKTTARKLTFLVEDFGILKKVISSANSFIQELLRKVPKSYENINLYINGKPILLTSGTIKSSTRLSEDELLAIKIFFGVER